MFDKINGDFGHRRQSLRNPEMESESFRGQPEAGMLSLQVGSALIPSESVDFWKEPAGCSLADSDDLFTAVNYLWTRNPALELDFTNGLNLQPKTNIRRNPP